MAWTKSARLQGARSFRRIDGFLGSRPGFDGERTAARLGSIRGYRFDPDPFRSEEADTPAMIEPDTGALPSPGLRVWLRRTERYVPMTAGRLSYCF